MVTLSPGESPKLVFFVPGIMGSSLFLTRKTAFGTTEKNEIWSKDIQSNLRIFHQKPDYLDTSKHDNIQSGEVIPYFENIRLPQPFLRRLPIPAHNVIVYQSLMEFCTKEDGLNLAQNQTFFPFAYNWLADNRNTAKKLAEFIEKQDKNGNNRFCFIAHSMGGIIVRLMLLNNQEIAQRTDLLFQIASPIKGSAKAYHSIRRYPNLNYIFDRAWQWLQKGESRADLQQALQQCYSLYQLLPSPEIISLFDEGGRGYSTLDKNIWHQNFYQYVDAAIDVHQQLAKSQDLNVKTKCVFSHQQKTLTHYIVDPDTFKIKRPVPEFIMGDDTVTVASAIAYTKEETRTLIKTSPGDHMGICQNKEVFNLLKQEWQSL